MLPLLQLALVSPAAWNKHTSHFQASVLTYATSGVISVERKGTAACALPASS